MARAGRSRFALACAPGVYVTTAEGVTFIVVRELTVRPAYPFRISNCYGDTFHIGSTS